MPRRGLTLGLSLCDLQSLGQLSRGQVGKQLRHGGEQRQLGRARGDQAGDGGRDGGRIDHGLPSSFGSLSLPALARLARLDVLRNPALDLRQRHHLRATDGRPAVAVGDLERATDIDQPEAEPLRERAILSVRACWPAIYRFAFAPRSRTPGPCRSSSAYNLRPPLDFGGRMHFKSSKEYNAEHDIVDGSQQMFVPENTVTTGQIACKTRKKNEDVLR
jgi:hypothetical protein